MENCKRDQEEMRQKLEVANSQLQNLQKQDWSKQILELKRENDFLRDEMSQKAKDFQNLKQNLAIAIQTSSSANAASHLTNLLET